MPLTYTTIGPSAEQLGFSPPKHLCDFKLVWACLYQDLDLAREALTEGANPKTLIVPLTWAQKSAFTSLGIHHKTVLFTHFSSIAIHWKKDYQSWQRTHPSGTVFEHHPAPLSVPLSETWVFYDWATPVHLYALYTGNIAFFELLTRALSSTDRKACLDNRMGSWHLASLILPHLSASEAKTLLRILERHYGSARHCLDLQGMYPDHYYLSGLSSIHAHKKSKKEHIDLTVRYTQKGGVFLKTFSMRKSHAWSTPEHIFSLYLSLSKTPFTLLCTFIYRLDPIELISVLQLAKTLLTPDHFHSLLLHVQSLSAHRRMQTLQERIRPPALPLRSFHQRIEACLLCFSEQLSLCERDLLEQHVSKNSTLSGIERLQTALTDSQFKNRIRTDTAKSI